MGPEKGKSGLSLKGKVGVKEVSEAPTFAKSEKIICAPIIF